ncbi:response regulator [Paenibacillus pasadenensis]|uniref:response regulator n=1 Tax=Paenibacillus pasadenensis TaxID=217090 RepID=UPI00041959F4|nr:response regulator [Paenibacillus pasadenensis]
MMRIIAVDDEQPALRRAGKLLEEMDGVRIGGLFDSAKRFLEHMRTSPEPVELVLLDIEMPGCDGLELARTLRTERPDIQIAFLTAYEEYAREAFEVEAIDYLLKPFTADDLARTVRRAARRLPRERLEAAASEAPSADSRPRLAVSSFGPFSVVTEQGRAVAFRNSKSRELLAYLHQFGGKPVGKAQILEALWREKDAERSQATLYSTVYQLRKDLEACGLRGLLESSKTAGGCYRLCWPGPVDDDVAAYGRLLADYRQTQALGPAMQAIQTYGEGFLHGSGYAWAAPRQAELELGYAELLESAAGACFAAKRYEAAQSLLQKWTLLLPLEETAHARMIALLIAMGKIEEAREYRALLLDLLDADEASRLPDFSRFLADPERFFERSPLLTS